MLSPCQKGIFDDVLNIWTFNSFTKKLCNKKSIFKAKLRHLYLKALVHLDQTSLCASMWLWKKLKALPLPNGDLIHNIRHNQNTPRLLHDKKLSGKIYLGGKKKTAQHREKMSSFRRETKSQPPLKSGEMSVFGFKKPPPREPEKQSLPKSASSLPWWRVLLVTTNHRWLLVKTHGSFENFMGSRKSPPLSSSSMGPNSPKHHLLPVSHPLPEWVSRLKKSQFFKKHTFIASILNCKVFLFKKASGWRIIFQSQPESQKVTKKRNRSKKQTEKHEILEFPKIFSQKKKQTLQKWLHLCPEWLSKTRPKLLWRVPQHPLEYQWRSMWPKP